MPNKKKRKHNNSSFFPDSDGGYREYQEPRHESLPEKRGSPALFQKVEEWTRLEWLRHRQNIASKDYSRGIDYGMSQLLTDEAMKNPLIKAMLNNESPLSYNNGEYNWSYLLNFACAAGSEKSASYILEKLMHENSKHLKTILSDNTPLCYAASSGNMSLCQKLSSEKYGCIVDVDVMRYASLSGNIDFVHNLHQLFEKQMSTSLGSAL